MDTKQRGQARYYSKLAQNYDEHFQRENPNHLYKIQQIGKALTASFEGRDDLRILEIGAGTGIHASHLLREHGHQIGRLVLTDLSPEMLEQAKRRLEGAPQAEFVASPAEHLDVDGVFDGIYVSGAMHHFSDPRGAIAGARKLLAPDGVLVICEPIVWNPLNFVKAAIKREEWGQFVVTRRNVRRFVAAAGFHVVDDRVLHWNGGTALADRLWPKEHLEQLSLCDTLAVMFLITARA